MIKNTIFFLILIVFLNSCAGVKEAGKVIRNEKIITTDEFLVKKKNPLVLPPNYEQIPAPESINQKEINDDEKIKKILRSPEKEKIKNKSSSLEDSILKKIKE